MRRKQTYTVKRRHLSLIGLPLISALLLSGPLLASAQDDGDGAVVAVLQAPTLITVPDGEPLVLWVRDVDDGIASAVVMVETDEGGYQDAMIPAEGTEQGDMFFLASE
jgi:hypothetical protein